jgi:UDP:flavonoid glycosyltransferase YjiC (YdhE family)
MEDIPHAWLFHGCKAVIHHGGAGTTAAGLRAGIPNLIIPFTADQPFWGARVSAIGAGPLPIPVKKLTSEMLINALTEVKGDTIRRGAQAAGRKIRAENGVEAAVQLIEEYAVKGLKS